MKKIAVLKGGPSEEREVSLRSGGAVAKGLREAGHDVREIDVTGCEVTVPDDVDVVFIALHGTFGEDGGVQALLDGLGVPYTGSGAAASRTAFDKVASKKLFVESDIPTPDYEVLHRGDKRSLPLPVVVKPSRQGSSIGVHKVFEESEWNDAFGDALSYDEDVVVEAYIDGRELTVGIVEGEALPVVEIAARDDWYDYEAKYTEDAGTRYLVPAPIDETSSRSCRSLASRAFEALGCTGFGRADFRMSETGMQYLLEMNTIPGFTATSLLPKAAAEAGMSFSELCDRIVKTCGGLRAECA